MSYPVSLSRSPKELSSFAASASSSHEAPRVLPEASGGGHLAGPLASVTTRHPPLGRIALESMPVCAIILLWIN